MQSLYLLQILRKEVQTEQYKFLFHSLIEPELRNDEALAIKGRRMRLF